MINIRKRGTFHETVSIINHFLKTLYLTSYRRVKVDLITYGQRETRQVCLTRQVFTPFSLKLVWSGKPLTVMMNNIAISCEGLARSLVIFIMDYQFANSLREKSGIQVSIMLSQNTATPVVHTSQPPAPKPGESLVGMSSAASGPSVVGHTGGSGVAGEQSPSRCTSTSSCGSRGGRGPRRVGCGTPRIGTCRIGIGQRPLAGQQFLKSNLFQDFTLFVYICMYSVLTFQTWMVLCISVNCYFVLGL